MAAACNLTAAKKFFGDFGCTLESRGISWTKEWYWTIRGKTQNIRHEVIDNFFKQSEHFLAVTEDPSAPHSGCDIANGCVVRVFETKLPIPKLMRAVKAKLPGSNVGLECGLSDSKFILHVTEPKNTNNDQEFWKQVSDAIVECKDTGVTVMDITVLNKDPEVSSDHPFLLEFQMG